MGANDALRTAPMLSTTFAKGVAPCAKAAVTAALVCASAAAMLLLCGVFVRMASVFTKQPSRPSVPGTLRLAKGVPTTMSSWQLYFASKTCNVQREYIMICSRGKAGHPRSALAVY